MRPLSFLATTALFLLLAISGCQGPKRQAVSPEPHLELGQQIDFVGQPENKTFVIVGYREEYEGPIEKTYYEQPYVVFLYRNDVEDFGYATIHVNSIVKK